MPLTNLMTNPLSSITPAPPPGVLVADRFTPNPAISHVLRPAGTRDWLLTYTLAGEGCLPLASQLTCRAGNVVVLEPGTPPQLCHPRASNVVELLLGALVQPRERWAPWLRWGEPLRGLRLLSLADGALRHRVVDCWERLLADSHGSNPWQMALALNALEELLILLAQQYALIRTPLRY